MLGRCVARIKRMPTARANSFDYLTELQRHAGELAANPAEGMLWSYRETLGRAGV
jgi:hypothetical protein